MRYVAYAYENVGPTAMMSLAPNDPVEFIGRFEVEAPSVPEALERVWYVGNKMGPDALGKEWPSDHRSMCVGDVVTIRESGGGFDPPCGRYVAAAVGWEPTTSGEGRIR
jgi:hypothetical protein